MHPLLSCTDIWPTRGANWWLCAGLSFQDFYQRCREAFLVNSDLTLRTQLTEFRDHKLIRTRKVCPALVWYLNSPVEGSLKYLFLPLGCWWSGIFAGCCRCKHIDVFPGERGWQLRVGEMSTRRTNSVAWTLKLCTTEWFLPSKYVIESNTVWNTDLSYVKHTVCVCIWSFKHLWGGKKPDSIAIF